jgi:hypothetical protein
MNYAVARLRVRQFPDQEQRVTVRRCPHDGLGGNAAASARAVLDDKRLSKSFRQRLTDQPRDNVGCATGAKAFDQVRRPRWIVLRASELRCRWKGGNSRCEMEELTPWKLHRVPQIAGSGGREWPANKVSIIFR